MKSFINDLWNGNLQPHEDIGLTPEMKTALSSISKSVTLLKEKSDESVIEILDEISEKHYEYTSLVISEAFKIGFKLGARAILEIED